MINQQLTDFIKEQLERGADRNLISKGLMANNWTKQDIEEGFNSINAPFKIESPISDLNIQSNHLDSTVVKNNYVALKVVITVLILFLLAGGVFGYFFRNNIPFIKNLIKSENVTTNEVSQNLPPESHAEEYGLGEEPIISESNKKIDLIIKDTGIDDVKSEDEVISTEVIPINCIDNTNCSQ